MTTGKSVEPFVIADGDRPYSHEDPEPTVEEMARYLCMKGVCPKPLEGESVNCSLAARVTIYGTCWHQYSTPS